MEIFESKWEHSPYIKRDILCPDCGAILEIYSDERISENIKVRFISHCN